MEGTEDYTRPPPSPPMSPHPLPPHAHVSAFSVVTPHTKMLSATGPKRSASNHPQWSSFVYLSTRSLINRDALHLLAKRIDATVYI
ncbi:hypothetical protein Pmani_029022 [Petrolisthes manimaculis]|uniref:Uncharacterized protein n=1 Tax=Petrolisthes manimaculis TaxID=1843537 RepID=A0AAE1P0U4_9EUCA|nr:hypothetical protein Pmani_029022 [Petrolisthes manimaculis]